MHYLSIPCSDLLERKLLTLDLMQLKCPNWKDQEDFFPVSHNIGAWTNYYIT